MWQWVIMGGAVLLGLFLLLAGWSLLAMAAQGEEAMDREAMALAQPPDEPE